MKTYSQLFVPFQDKDTLRGVDTDDGDAVNGSRLVALQPAAWDGPGREKKAKPAMNRRDAALLTSVRSMRMI